jgi:hypothetical protein
MRNEQEEEGDDHPGGEINGNGIYFLLGTFGGRVGITNTRAGNQEGREGEPESTVRSERFSKITQDEYARNKSDGGNDIPVAPKVLPVANSHIPARN